MKRDLTAILTDIKSGKRSSVLLLFGDDLQVKMAREAILDVIVPAEERGFNFERFDGRLAPWNQIEASLMTPPFFPGKKLLWIENAPYFMSREQKGEFSEQILQLWAQGNKDAAVKVLSDLLVVEGWSQDQWDRLELSSAEPLCSLLEVDDREARVEAEALLVYAKSSGLDLERRRGAQGHRLFDLFNDGIPEWSFLLLTALQVDRRTRLYKLFEEKNAVLFLGLERDRTGRVSREQLIDFVNERMQKARKTLDPGARELILSRAGMELRALDEELNKLLLFVGDRAAVRPEDVDIIFADHGQGWIFDLTRAIGDGNAPAALSELARLMAEGEHPLKLLATIASEIRRLLIAREVLAMELRGQWKHGMTYSQFQQIVMKDRASTRNPFADYMCFQRAEHFSLKQLRSYMEGIYETDLCLKSSGSAPRLVLERLILKMCLGAGRQRTRSHQGAEI